MENFEQRTLNLLNSKAFGRLNAFYHQTTLFNVIGAERSENRHSAFIAWLLNPESSHGLGTVPIKLFLRLVATLKWGRQTFGNVLYRKVLAGNYEVDFVEPVETEKCLGNKNDRIDIWMVLRLTYEEDGIEVCQSFPLVIENKIYSSEGRNQTKRYYDLMIKYISSISKSGDTFKPIGILLSPEGKTPDCSQFTSMTYQKLLDYVLEPVSTMISASDGRSFVESYIRNLSKTAEGQDYSPLAISEKERSLIKDVYNVDPGLFDSLLAAVFGSKVDGVLNVNTNCPEDENERQLLQEVWDSYEEIIKAVIYESYSDKKEILSKLFKGNNRDNSKYRVYYGKDNTEVFPGKRLSKAMAACAIFKAYLACKPDTNLEQLRKAFPCENINAYYWDNYYEDLFYLLPDDIDEGGELCLTYTSPKRQGKDALAKWDFYIKDELLLPLENATKQAMCVKLWRKADFDRLIKHLEDNGFASFINVELCL